MLDQGKQFCRADGFAEDFAAGGSDGFGNLGTVVCRDDDGGQASATHRPHPLDRSEPDFAMIEMIVGEHDVGTVARVADQIADFQKVIWHDQRSEGVPRVRPETLTLGAIPGLASAETPDPGATNIVLSRGPGSRLGDAES